MTHILIKRIRIKIESKRLLFYSTIILNNVFLDIFISNTKLWFIFITVQCSTIFPSFYYSIRRSTLILYLLEVKNII